jgi:hypothetical protein
MTFQLIAAEREVVLGKLREGDVDFLIEREFDPAPDERLGFSSRTAMSLWRVEKAHGRGGGKSSLPNS